MLSNRLLSQFSYNTEREIRNLELLKLRFGEASLQQCEVMLKDISDSKRINHAITGIVDIRLTDVYGNPMVEIFFFMLASFNGLYLFITHLHVIQ